MRGDVREYYQDEQERYLLKLNLETKIIFLREPFSRGFVTQSNSSREETVLGELELYQRNGKEMGMVC